MGEVERKKIIIDTDPGIDDAMAIFIALRSPDLEVIGLTTTHGNVYTTLATRNALHLHADEKTCLRGTFLHFYGCATGYKTGAINALFFLVGIPTVAGRLGTNEPAEELEIAGRSDIPVAEGSHATIKKVTKLRIASFVHGSDGLGNQNFPPPQGKAIDQSAAEFLVEKANQYPGKVTVVALGTLTNIALAIELDPGYPQKVGQIVILGGAFSVNGNVNPAAEANIFGDPDAADIVFTSGADILAVGINITHQVILTDADRSKLERSEGKFAQYICKILEFYFSYHRDAYGIQGVYLHDPTTVIAAAYPSLLTYTEGVVRVQTSGITRGLTLFDNTKKRYAEITEWSNKPKVKVAVTVDAPAVVEILMDRLMNS